MTRTVTTAGVQATKTYYFGSQRVAVRENGVLSFLHSDQLSSVSASTDANGKVVGRQLFEPFGAVRATFGEVDGSWGWATHRKSEDTGLTFMRARWYAPGVGRFVSPDSIVPGPSEPQSFNRYSYSRNSPVGRVDASGHGDCNVHSSKDSEAWCRPTPKLNLDTHRNTSPQLGYSQNQQKILPSSLPGGEWHAPMSVPQPYTVKVLGQNYQTTVGSIPYQVDQAAYAILPTTVGLSLGDSVSYGTVVVPVASQASSKVSAACNWRSAECGTFSGYQISSGIAGGGGASGNLDLSLFAAWGNSTLAGVAGPSNTYSLNGKLIPGVGANAAISWSQSVDPDTKALAVDETSGHRINTVGISAGPSLGGDVEVSVQVSPAYLPGIPWALNNTSAH